MAFSSPRFAAALLAVTSLAGCSGVYTTVQFPPQRDDRILGEWVGDEEDKIAVITEAGEGYLLAPASGGQESENIEFTLSRVGGRTYLQSPVEDCAGFDVGEQACYHIVLMRLAGDRMALDRLNADRVAADSFSGDLAIPHELHREVRGRDGSRASNEIVLFSTKKELEETLDFYMREESALEELARLRRPK